jgi:hypothetical protein
LKQKLVKHCKAHNEPDKQDPKTRRKAHKERNAARGENVESDSDDTLDSQAPLIDEIDSVKARLKLAKELLKVKQDSLRLAGALVDTPGDDICE